MTYPNKLLSQKLVFLVEYYSVYQLASDINQKKFLLRFCSQARIRRRVVLPQRNSQIYTFSQFSNGLIFLSYSKCWSLIYHVDSETLSYVYLGLHLYYCLIFSSIEYCTYLQTQKREVLFYHLFSLIMRKEQAQFPSKSNQV